MTEKTFRDMLPLTDEQRKDLKNKTLCASCFLDYRNNVAGDLCHDFVKTHAYGCNNTRAEALRIDDAYRKENMKKDILSQGEFNRRVSLIFNDEFDKSSSALTIKKEYAAALERIADLEDKIKWKDLELENSKDNCRNFISNIAELEKQLEIALKAQNGNADYAEEKRNECMMLRKKIADLESLIAAYDLVQMDTKYEAKLKAREKVAEFLRREMDFEFRNDLFYKKYIVNERLQYPDGGSPEYYEFQYAEPREPQPGDLVVCPMGNHRKGKFFVGAVRKISGDEIIIEEADNGVVEIKKIKQITHRVDENGNIVPIAKRSKN